MAKIYLSSTYSDLKEYREAVYRTLHQMGHSVIAMEDYVATDQRPLAKCVSDVAACEIYIGLFAWRYGYIPLEDGNPDRKSITELEYRTACQQDIPRLTFLLHEDADWSLKKTDSHTGDGEQGALIAAFRKELGTDNLASFFKSPDELAKLVSVAVGNLSFNQNKQAKRLVPFMADKLPEHFVPRPEEFKQLVTYLLGQPRNGAQAITVALRGAGGYGKTMLARAVCHDEHVRGAYSNGVLWVTLGKEPGDLTKHITPLIYALSHERPVFNKVEEATYQLTQLLGDRKLLIVIDDVWEQSDLEPFWQGGPRCARLITTRNAALTATAQKVRVDAMREDEAIALLTAGLPVEQRVGVTTVLSKLSERLGKWPLLLELVNGTLRRRVEDDCQPLPDALGWVNRALDIRGLTIFDDTNAESRSQAVAKTIGVSLDLLKPVQRARYGELAIFPEDVEIPLPTLEKLWGRTGATDGFNTEVDTEDLCSRLNRLSLLWSYDAKRRRIRLHNVVRAFLLTQHHAELPGLHNQLLEALQPSVPAQPSNLAPAQNWATLPADEPYLWQHLAFHLIEAKREAELVATVKDWRYLTTKTWLRNAAAVEADLLAAMDRAAGDEQLLVLLRNFTKMGHLLNRCEDQRGVEATLYSRLKHLAELQPMLLEMRAQLQTPFLAALNLLPDQPHPALIRALEGHEKRVFGCAVSEDGKLVVSASDDGTVRLWNGLSGALLHTRVGHTSSVLGCAVSGDAKLVASVAADRTVRLWDGASGALLHTLEGHADWVRGCALSADGRLVVSASDDRTVRLWDGESGALLHTLKGHDGNVMSCATNRDGSVLVTGSTDKMVQLWRWKKLKKVKKVKKAKKEAEPVEWDEKWELEKTLTGHAGDVNCCRVSADGKLAVSASNDGTVRLWDGESGALLQTFMGPKEPVNGCAVSEDGTLVVSVSDDGKVRLWEWAGKALISTLAGHKGPIRVCTISGDGMRLASAGDDGTLQLWKRETDTLLLTFKDQPGSVTGCALSEDGKLVVSSSSDGNVRLWDGESGTLLHTLTKHNGRVNACAVSGDGKLVVSAGDDETVRLWDGESGVLLQTLTGHKGRVRGCAVSDDGKLLVSVATDLTVRLWRWKKVKKMKTEGEPAERKEGWELEQTLIGHSGYVNKCAVSGDGKLVLSASDDKTVRLWKCGDTHKEGGGWALLHTLEGIGESVSGCEMSRDGKLAVVASNDGTVRLWDGESGALLQTFTARERKMHDCAISRDGKLVVSTTEDGKLWLWNGPSGVLMQTLAGHKGPVHGIALSGDGKLLVSAGDDSSVRLWNRTSEATQHTPEGHTDSVRSCAVSANGKVVVSASHDTTVRLWDGGSGALLQTLTGYEGKVNGCAVSRDGKLVVSASDDKTVRLRERASEVFLHTLKGHLGSVNGCAVSGDGKLVASAADDGTVRLWNGETGKLRRTLKGHAGPVYGCAMSDDGKLLVSAADDGMVRLWDWTSGARLHKLAGHDGPVYGCALSGDGKLVVSAADDGTIRLWDWTSKALLQMFKGHMGAVNGCAMSVDGKLVVSAADDGTVRIWDAVSGKCFSIFYADDELFSCAIHEPSGLILATGMRGVYFLKFVQSQ